MTSIQVSGHKIIEDDGYFNKQLYVSVACETCDKHIETALMSLTEYRELVKATKGRVFCKAHKQHPRFYELEIDTMKDRIAIQSERIHTQQRDIKILQIAKGKLVEENRFLKEHDD
jgi:hypothetical protein